MARNLAASNPVCRVKFFNDDNSRLRYLTEEEYNRLIEAARTVKTSPCLAEKIILSVHTGLRRGSLFCLRWDSVDFLNRVVRIPRTKERPATCASPERDCLNDSANALSGAPTGLPVRVRTRNGSPSGGARQGRQERVPHGTRDRQGQRLQLARPAAHLRLLADHEGCLAAIGGRTPGPSWLAYGHAVCASLAGVPVIRSGSVGRPSADNAASREALSQKGKKRATCCDAGSAAGESRRISEGNWLAALDDFRNWLICEAA